MSTKILMGSQYFFSKYPNFKSKDIDEIELVETQDFKYMRQLTGQGKCLFQLRKYSSKEEYINWALQSSIGMVIGKFLVPEFCALIDFTIDDLRRLAPLIERLDAQHKYEEIIYNSYLENNAFVLTEAQRDLAYKSYNESRGVY